MAQCISVLRSQLSPWAQVFPQPHSLVLRLFAGEEKEEKGFLSESSRDPNLDSYPNLDSGPDFKDGISPRVASNTLYFLGLESLNFC